ncbi:hypothetical protein K438DRAFT_1787110 [Mycena galopus ATCC 62051]|nr:hypothetical protein K438DRAFT_1787110 [Mycena galopus ATCC 62051]
MWFRAREEEKTGSAQHSTEIIDIVHTCLEEKTKLECEIILDRDINKDGLLTCQIRLTLSSNRLNTNLNEGDGTKITQVDTRICNIGVDHAAHLQGAFKSLVECCGNPRQIHREASGEKGSKIGTVLAAQEAQNKDRSVLEPRRPPEMGPFAD